MDNFLREQTTGQVVDTQNKFTLDRARSRKKLLASIPKSSLSSVLRLFDSAAVQFGYRPANAVYQSVNNDGQTNYYLQVYLPDLDSDQLARFLDEMRRPFGPPSAESTLARAVYRATSCFSGVSFKFHPNALNLILSDITLTAGSLELPERLEAGAKKGLRLSMSGLGRREFAQHRRSISRRVYSMTEFCERLLPLESFSSEVSGFFDYRSKPFTPIRSYAAATKDQEGLMLDLWEGPYQNLDEQTVMLQKKKPGKFLFFRWRPNYGRPTFLHHTLGAPLEFGEQSLRATFWVETTDRPAHVHFFTGRMVSDPIPVKGPVGFTGIVLWPGLKFDLWGTQLVQDKAYQEAYDWTCEQVRATADCLHQNLDAILEQIAESNLIKKSYVDETIRKVRGYWSK